MHETDFILCPPEQTDLIGAFRDEGMTFVPDMPYKTSSYLELISAKEVQNIASSNDLSGPVFILSPRFSKYPLRIRPVHVNYLNEQRYFLTQRRGGPYLDLLPCRFNQEKQPPLLKAGFIAYYSTYYIDDDFTEVPAPPELKELYQFGRAWLRGSCERVVTEGGKRVYWVGHEAYRALRDGKYTTVQGVKI